MGVKVDDFYDEKLDYDKNGNILSLYRTTKVNDQKVIIDDLAYTYTANQLQTVTDATNSAAGFNDGNKVGIDYTYDAFGNLKTDKNKSITNITYNHLNLPVEITFATGKITYTYDATGTKVKKVVQPNSGVAQTTDYLYGFQYLNGALQFFPHAEGYVKPNGTNSYLYVYQYKDHLGNVRLSYADCDGNGTINPATEILEENNYYPFGLQHQGYNDIANSYRSEEAEAYKLNGKEYEDSFGLNIYEMDLRQLDPAIGRWTVMDPVTHHDYSPYSAFDNNPVFWSDPSGADADIFKLNGRLVGASFTGQDAIDAFKHLVDGSANDNLAVEVQNTYELATLPGDEGGGGGNGNGGGDPKKKKGPNKASTETIAAVTVTAKLVETAGIVGSVSWLSVFGTAILLNGDTSPDRFAQFARYGEVAGSWPWQHAASRDIVESINSRKNNSGYYIHYTSLKSAYSIWESKTIRPGLSNIVYVTNAIMTPSEAYSILFQSQSTHRSRGEAVIIMKLHQYQEASLKNEVGGDVFELQHYGPLRPANIIYAGPNPFGN